jgi:hypothetical protein
MASFSILFNGRMVVGHVTYVLSIQFVQHCERIVSGAIPQAFPSSSRGAPFVQLLSLKKE